MEPNDPDEQADADAIHAFGQFFDERHDAMTAAGSGTVEVSTLRETRKPQECVTCGRIILKGEAVLFQKRRPAIGCPTSHYYCDGCRESWPSERIEAPAGPTKAEMRRRAAADRVNRSVRIAAELSRDLKAERDAAMVPAKLPAADLTRDFLAGLSASTRATYVRCFRAFAAWAGHRDVPAACAAFLSLSPGEANMEASRWRSEMLDRGLSPSTAEVRISALRSLIRAGTIAGTHSSQLSIPPMRSARVAKGRRTIGAAREDVERMLAVATVSERAMLRLLADRGFRAGTVAALRRGDFDPATGTVMATGKGLGSQRDARTLAKVTADAVAEHLAATSGDADDPMFGRLRTSKSVARWVAALAARAGVPRFKCHSLRALAITSALDATGGDIRSVQAFAGHSSPATTLMYDTTRRDLAGEVAKRVMGETR